MLGMAALMYLMAAAAGLLLYLYMFYPVVFIHFYFRMAVILSGMKLNYTDIDGMTICYGEKGKRRKDRPSMIFIHGFTACKFMWAPIVKNLSHDFHVIAVDLPGHGDSDEPAEHEDLSHTVTVQKMRKLLSRLEFDSHPFHLIGMSMGGALAGLYAAEYPDHVHSLTLVCPAMKTPRESPLWEEINQALENKVEELHKACTLLFPTTASQVQYMLHSVQFHNGWVPKQVISDQKATSADPEQISRMCQLIRMYTGRTCVKCVYMEQRVKEAAFLSIDIKQILHGVAQFRRKYYPFYARLFNMLTQPHNHNLLRDCAPRINVPTQIIWGEEDKVIDVSGVHVLKEALPNCVQVNLIPRCGHSMTTDRPGAMTKAILTFKQKLQDTR